MRLRNEDDSGTISQRKCRYWIKITFLSCAVIVTMVICLFYTRPSLLPGGMFAYIVPTANTWDKLYETSDVWSYNSLVHEEVVHFIAKSFPNATTVLDLACNQGFMLDHLGTELPNIELYGTDISNTMVAKTKETCKRCHTAQFDIHRILRKNVSFEIDGFPSQFDVIIVSDVLLYVSWGGCLPFMVKFGWCPEEWMQETQRNFMNNLRNLGKHVVFSSHQQNKVVMKVFGDEDIRPITFNGKRVFIL